MAGLPEEVIERAKMVLKNLESSELVMGEHGRGKKSKESEIQLTMFEIKDDALREEINKLDVDAMTPLQALEALALLKKKIETKDE